jgi:C1A family cysteine protease
MQLNELILVILVIILVAYASRSTAPTWSPTSAPGFSPRALMSAGFVGLSANLEEAPMMSFARSSVVPEPLPRSKNIWNDLVPVVDQGPWGSCTAFAMRYAYMLWHLRTVGTLPPEPSVAYWYAQSRTKLLGGNLQDTGSTTAATVWVLANLGTPTNTTWPYTAANVFIKPTISALTNPKNTVPVRITTFKNAASTLDILKRVIADNKTLLASIMVYSSMMKISVFVSGVVPMPNIRRESLQGGHAIAITGYDDTIKRFIFRNSWGSYDGINGQYTIPYDYITNPQLASSFFAF